MCSGSLAGAIGRLLNAVEGLDDPGPALDEAERELRRLGEPIGDLRQEVTELTWKAAARRDREDGLRALVRTSEQLLNVSAVDELLDVIARAAREQLRCDVAHLNILGEDGMATTRTCVGAFTEAFRRQRTASGSGITGLVATTRSAYVSEDYMVDPRITHDPTGDDSVGAERLRTLVGAPLFRGETVIGVLVASYRTPTTISTEHLGTLNALASFAALALSGAQVRDERETALAELQHANVVVRDNNDLLEWSSAAHDRMMRLLLEGADVESVAEAVRSLIGGSVLIRDAEGAILAGGPEELAAGLPRVEREASEPGGRLRRWGDGDTRCWLAPVVASGEVLGSLVLVRPAREPGADLNPLEERTLERAAMVCALRILLDRSIFEGELRVAGEVVDDLVAGGERGARAVARAGRFGLDVRTPCVVLRAESTANAAGFLRAAQRFARRLGGLAGAGRPVHQLTVVVPCPESTSPEAVAESLWTALAEAGPEPPRVGGSTVASSPDGLVAAYAEASDCLTAVQRLASRRRWGTPGSLGFIGSLLSTNGGSSLSAYAGSVLEPVLDYDARRGTVLVATLEAYLDSGRSLQQAAVMLNVHRNTVQQRLERVGWLLGTDWQDVDRVLEIHLALRLHRVRAGTGSASG